MKLLTQTLLILAIFSCGGNKFENKSSPVEDITIISSDVEIDFHDCGEGEITLLFVHGWCINKSYWVNQVKAFCNDYRVVAIDLPGFGNSGKNRQEWTIEQYGKDVNAVVDQLKLRNVILIGHSMGGDIVLEAALNNKEILALVGVDNFKGVGFDYDAEVKAQLEGFMDLFRNDFRSMAANYAQGNLFHTSTSEAVKARVINNFINSTPEISISSLENLLDYTPKESPGLSKLQRKLYLINSNATPTYIEGLELSGVDFEILEIDSTGHYPMIEKPEVFNDLLTEVLSSVIANR